MNFVLAGELIVFGADTGSRAAKAVGQRVAFEVDRSEHHRRAGWSVVAQGVLEDAADFVQRELDEQLKRLEPWAPGPKDRWLKVHVREVTGRWVRAAGQPTVDDGRGHL